MRGFESEEFRIELRWQNNVVYWEGSIGYLFDAEWGVDPPVLWIPTAEMWRQVVPDWLRDRREVIVDRLASLTPHRLQEDGQGCYRADPERRVIHAD